MSPIKPPINALIAAIIAIVLLDEDDKINDKIINGANFCHVARIRHDSQDADAITDGNHKWHGTMPNLRIIDIIKIKDIIFLGIEWLNHIDMLDINIILDPRAWARKYLIAASVS